MSEAVIENVSDPIPEVDFDFKDLHYVRIHNTPKFIVDEWTEVLTKDPEKLGKYLIPFGLRKLEFTKDEIRVVGMAWARDIEEPIIALHGPNADKIGFVIACPAEGESVTPLRYYPVYDNLEVEKQYATKVQNQVMTRPTTGVGAVIYKVNEEGEREFLLGRRVTGPQHYLNLFSNFGGAVDLGETKTTALRRELLEECNLDIGDTVPEHLCDNETIAKYPAGDTYHAYSHTYIVQVSGGNDIRCMEPSKVRNFGWYKESYIRDNMEELTDLAKQSFNCFFQRFSF